MDIATPNRKKHSYTQHLDAPPEIVFPLLCPVAELKWAPGWMPEKIFSRSGVIEKECIFITPPEFPKESHNAIWIVTSYDPSRFSLVMYKVVPEHTISKLEIALEGETEHSTRADISYEITATGMAGNEFIEEFTEDRYKSFMLDWQTALNHYLNTGEIIA